jgi:hypothetical protein
MAHGLKEKKTTGTALGEIRQAKAMPAVSAPGNGAGSTPKGLPGNTGGS